MESLKADLLTENAFSKLIMYFRLSFSPTIYPSLFSPFLFYSIFFSSPTKFPFSQLQQMLVQLFEWLRKKGGEDV